LLTSLVRDLDAWSLACVDAGNSDLYAFEPDWQEGRIPFPPKNPARDRLTRAGPPGQPVRAVTAGNDETLDARHGAVQRKPVQ
jgi:hypothetical protein